MNKFKDVKGYEKIKSYNEISEIFKINICSNDTSFSEFIDIANRIICRNPDIMKLVSKESKKILLKNKSLDYCNLFYPYNINGLGDDLSEFGDGELKEIILTNPNLLVDAEIQKRHDIICDSEIIKKAIKTKACLIKCFPPKFVSEHILSAVLWDANIIKYISPEMCNDNITEVLEQAVIAKPKLLKSKIIKKSGIISNEFCKNLINTKPKSIKYIESRYLEKDNIINMLDNLIEKHKYFNAKWLLKNNIKFLLDEKIQIRLLKIAASNLKYIPNQTDAKCKLAISNSLLCFKYVHKQTEELCYYAFNLAEEQNLISHLYPLIKPKLYKDYMDKKLIETNPININMIPRDRQTEELSIFAIEKTYEKFGWIPDSILKSLNNMTENVRKLCDKYASNMTKIEDYDETSLLDPKMLFNAYEHPGILAGIPATNMSMKAAKPETNIKISARKTRDNHTIDSILGKGLLYDKSLKNK